MTEEELENTVFEKANSIISDYTDKDGKVYYNFSTLETVLFDFAVELNKQLTEKDKQIEELQHHLDSLQGYLDHDIEYDIEQRNKELEAQIAELKKENELIKNSDSLCRLIGEQKLQIEKMKCCDNCNLYQCTKWKNHEVDYHYAKCENWQLK